MKIGELSRRTGCPVPRIRFYESKGVLAAPARTAGGQREYTNDDVRRLDFVMTCRTNGMKLECIERFLQFADDPTLGSDWLLARLDEYLAHIRQARSDLDRLEGYLRALRGKFPAHAQAQEGGSPFF